MDKRVIARNILDEFAGLSKMWRTGASGRGHHEKVGVKRNYLHYRTALGTVLHEESRELSELLARKLLEKDPFNVTNHHDSMEGSTLWV